MQHRPVEQQVVVIFGGSSGIGRAAALDFARRGARVMISARSQDSLDELVAQIKAEGGEAAGWAADATDFAQVQAVAVHTANLFGRIDTWVHAAAVMMYASFEQTTPEEFRRLIDVNLVGAFHGAKAAYPYLKKDGGGTLILIASVEGRLGLPFHSAYAASKHGMIGLAEVLRMEFAEQQAPVDVVTILPAGVNTPLYDKALTRLGVRPQPAPPIYTPEVAARQIVYAAQHGGRELPVTDAARTVLFLQRLAPRLTEFLMRKYAYQAQRSQQPKSEHAPHNLFGYVPGHDTVDGPYPHKSLPVSVGDFLRSSPVLRWGLLAGLGAAGLLVGIKKRGA